MTKPTGSDHHEEGNGGNGPHTLRRVIEYGDEWMPIVGREHASIEQRIPELARLAEDAGRAPIPISIVGLQPDPQAIDRWASLGVSRCIFSLPAAGPEVVLPRLKECAETMQAVA